MITAQAKTHPRKSPATIQCDEKMCALILKENHFTCDVRAGNRLPGQSTVDLLHWNLETPPQFPPSVLVVEYGLPMEIMYQEHTKRHTMRVIVMEPGYF
jgi:hypothetical protein